MKPLRSLLLAAIRGYKRHVSPRKGFACAYRVHVGACSCSTLGLRAVARYGAWRGLGVLRLRLGQCRLVAEDERARRVVARGAQAGFVDCDVPCDASCIDGSCLPGEACEVVACLDCSDVDGCGSGCWPRGRADAPPRPPVRRRRRRGDPPTGVPAPRSPAD
jgi:putative component of membrane protein insertase Oxa1/YidC/SpoIIIJ protein YidD